MSQKPFAKVYKEYTLQYTQKNYENCLKIYQDFAFKGIYFKYREPVNFLLRSAGVALNNIKNPSNQFKVVVLNSFKDVFDEIADTAAYDNILSRLNLFTSPKDLEHVMPIFASLPPSENDLKSWIKCANVRLFEAIQTADTASDPNHQKEVYLKMSHTLLTFVYAEAQISTASKGRWQFKESCQFLNNCLKCKLFEQGEGVKQYHTCFKLLKDFLVALSTASDSEFITNLNEFHLNFKSLNKKKEIRATLTKDNFITLTKIIKICESRFTESVDSKIVPSIFNMIEYVAFGSSQVKSENPYCGKCESLGTHGCHDTSIIAGNLYLKLIGNGITNEIVGTYANIISNQFESLSTLSCVNEVNLQKQAINMFNSIVKKCKTKEEAQFVIPVLSKILKRWRKIKLNADISKYFNVTSVLNNLFNAVNCTENWEELIKIGYLLMVFLLYSSETPNNFEHIAWTVAKKQKDNTGTIATKTPYDHFNKTEDLKFGLKMPDNFDVSKLSLAFLRVGFKYAVMASEVSNKIIHQIVMNAKPHDTNSLRFALSIQSMNFDEITNKRIKTLTAAMQKLDSDSVRLQLAAIKYLKFNYDSTQMTEQYKEFSISDALTESGLASEQSIFRQMTFEYEKGQISTLRDVKEAFIRFGKYYLGLESDDDRNKFDDEKELLLRELKPLANQFIIRNYSDDGLDLFMTLYNLAKAVKDDYGIIDSCSYFAENSHEFKRKFPNLNLKEIISICYGVAVQKLKELTTLSARKQTQVCYCLLNLVLYYYEDGGDNQANIILILRFVFTTIGGIGDAELESSAQDIIGRLKMNDPMPTINSQSVRIKFYAVMFTIITKYGAKSCFHPSKFIKFVLEYVKKNLSVYSDSNAAVPIMLYNMLPEMVTWLLSNYEYDDNNVGLMLTLLKLAMRSGYVLRAASLIVVLLNQELMSEKLKGCQTKLNALECMVLGNDSGAADLKKVKEPVFGTDVNGQLCEPIRKQVKITSPMKCLSPKRTTTGKVTIEIAKYLAAHRSKCACGVCSSPQNKLHMFSVAVCYARYVYISNEFDENVKRETYVALYKFWEEKIEKSTDRSLYNLITARMLLHYSHFKAKFEKDYLFARDLLGRALNELNEIKHGVELMKIDLKHQYDDMEIKEKQKHMTRDEIYANVPILNRKKNFDTSLVDGTYTSEPKKKLAHAQAKPVVGPRQNLLDLLNHRRQPTDFGIYADGDDTEPVTPSVKKNPRGRNREIKETPIRTPSNLIGSDRSAAKKAEKPNVVRPRVPVKAIDLTTPPETKNAKPMPDLSPETSNGKSNNEPKQKEIAPKNTKRQPIRATRKAATKSD